MKSIEYPLTLASSASPRRRKLTKPQFRFRALSSSVRGHITYSVVVTVVTSSIDKCSLSLAIDKYLNAVDFAEFREDLIQALLYV